MVRNLIKSIVGYREFAFLHIGKTAGTSVLQQLGFVTNEIGLPVRRTENTFSKLYRGWVVHYYGHHHNLSTIPVHLPVIFFLRDPIARLESAFNYNKQLSGLRKSLVPSEELKYLDEFPTFGTWVDAAADLSHAKHRKALYGKKYWHHFKWTLEHHFQQASEEDWKRVIFIGRQESCDSDLMDMRLLLDKRVPKVIDQSQFNKSKRLVVLTKEQRIRACDLFKTEYFWYAKALEKREALIQ